MGERPEFDEREVEFSVVIPTLNSADTILECLTSVETALTSIGGGEIVVVDNGSTDNTVEIVRTLLKDETQPLTCAGTISEARNLGVHHSTGRTLSFVDSDCVVDPGYFLAARDRLRSGEWAAVGSPYALPDHPVWVEEAWDRLTVDYTDGPTHFLPGGNTTVQRAAFEAVGGFDESLVTGEDWDLGRRLGEAGFRQLRDHGVKVVHLGNPKTVGSFFRKQRWHGVSSLKQGASKTLAAVAVHVTLTLGSILGLLMVGPKSPLGMLAVLIGSQIAVPAAFLVHRLMNRAAIPSPVKAAYLYWVFLWARAVAAAMSLLGRHADRG